MKGYSVVGILVVAAGLLLSSSTGHAAYWVDYEVTDYVAYEEEGGDGQHDPSAERDPYCSATSWAQIEGSEQNAYAGCYAYVYETDTIMDYDPQVDPPLVAHVSCQTFSHR